MKQTMYGALATVCALVGITSIIMIDKYFEVGSVMALLGFVLAVYFGQLAEECKEIARLAKLADDCYDFMY